MINIAQKTIDFYLKNFKTPTLEDLKIELTEELNQKGAIFVTIYKKGEIRGAAGNIKEIKNNLAEEIIENTIQAISKDSRFKPVKLDEIKDIKIRIDNITNRKILKDNEILSIDPTINGVITIKKDYEKMAVILPNINPSLLSGEDFKPVLKEKLKEKSFEEKEYIIYKIETESENNFETK